MDDLRKSVDLETQAYGRVLQDGEVRARNSDVMLGSVHDVDVLIAGIDGGVSGVIVDLGRLVHSDMHQSVLWALERREDSVFIPHPEDYGRERDSILLPDSAVMAHAKVDLGHVYVVRLNEGKASTWAALLVTAHIPGQLITITWRLL